MDKPILELVDRRRNEPISDYFQGVKKAYDTALGCTVVKIFSGDWYVATAKDEMLVTILGSCVSACIRDPIAQIGGMNHFLLPGSNAAISDHSDAARYGMYAMESLINGILKAGGRKDRLEIKVFGGGNVIRHSTRIGSKNASFIREYLKREGFSITAADLEGDYPRRVHYIPSTGKVLLRKLHRKDDMAIVAEETRYTQTITQTPLEGGIDLF